MKRPVIVDDVKLQTVTDLLIKLTIKIAAKEGVEYMSPELEDLIVNKYPTVAALLLAYSSVLADIPREMEE